MSTTFHRARGGLYVPRGYAAAVLADSPLWFAKMDDTSGSTMVDSSGNSRSGSYVNSPTLNGAAGVTFNGTNQYANVPGASWMNTSDYTIEFALKTTANSVYCADRDDGTTSANKIWAGFVRVAGTIGFAHYTTSGASQQANGSTTVNDGAERHIACVKSGTSLLIYVGGTLDGSATFSSFNSSATQGIDIARRGNGSGFLPGTMRRVAYYGTALSSTRIAAHAAAM